MNKTLFLSFILSILGFCTACSSDEPGGLKERQEIKLDVKSRAVSDAINDFHVRFTTDVVSHVDQSPTEASKNVILSPLSASMSLGMLANGVDDVTSKQVYNYLGTSDLDALNKLMLQLQLELPKADSKASMTLANSIWYDEQLSLTSNFSSVVDEFYMPAVKPVDFASSTIKNKVNSWIENSTNGLIKNFNDNIDPYTNFMMINAMYFKDIWKEEYFRKEATKKKTFHGINGDNNIDFMSSYEYELQRCVTADFIAVKIPFGNGAFSITLVLPAEDLSTSEANQLLTADMLRSMENGMKWKKFDLYIPKFKLENKRDLTEVLSEYGKIDLVNSKLTLFNEAVRDHSTMFHQGCSFEINEKGVEAAVVSQTIDSLGAAITEPDIVTFDRPFYFFINEYSTGACLLSGRIADL